MAAASGQGKALQVLSRSAEIRAQSRGAGAGAGPTTIATSRSRFRAATPMVKVAPTGRRVIWISRHIQLRGHPKGGSGWPSDRTGVRTPFL